MVELRLLGALSVTAPERGDAASLTHQAKRVALLAYLAAAVPRGTHRRDRLLTLFWPELDQSHARNALNQAVHVLRASLGDDAITPYGDGALGVTDVVWCDVTSFESALDAGRTAEALALYRGDLLDGFFVPDAPEFERWIDGERERLRRRAAEGAWALAESKAAVGEAFEAARWARRATDLSPADEAGARRLMTLLHGLGDRAAAIEAYETLSSRLRDEYELEPSAETQALAATIRRDAGAAPAPPRADVSPATVPALAQPTRHRGRGRFVVAMAVAVALLAVVAWAWLHRPGAARLPVVRFTLEFPADHQMAPVVPGPQIALSPDGSQLAYLARGPQGNQLFLRSIDRVEAVPIPHTRGARLAFFSPDGEWLGVVIANAIRKVPLGGGPAITVCTFTEDVRGASWGPNGIIVFATTAGLWQVAAAGGEPRLVALADTARGERYRWPEVLPDGRAAVFTRLDSAGPQLAAVSLETGAVRRLGIEGTSPHFIMPRHLLFARPDGTLLAVPFDPSSLRVAGPAVAVADGVRGTGAGGARLGVSRSGTIAYESERLADRTLTIVDRAGNAQPVALPRRGLTAALFSPDGRRIAVSLAAEGGPFNDIWVLEPDTTTFRRLTFGGGNVGPVWSPDGGRIAFANGGRGYGWSVRWMAADGSDSAETLLPGAWGQFPGPFTPDGRTLVIQQRRPETGWDIGTLTLDRHRESRPYIAGPADEHSPALSPDGRWMAYVSNESGQDDVYVRPFPTPGAAVQVSSSGAREPRWSPDGRELFYRDGKGMTAVAVNVAGPFRVGGRRVLFDDQSYASATVAAAYDVHPDGRRFVMIRQASTDRELVIVLNWFAQLRADAATPQ